MLFSYIMIAFWHILTEAYFSKCLLLFSRHSERSPNKWVFQEQGWNTTQNTDRICFQRILHGKQVFLFQASPFIAPIQNRGDVFLNLVTSILTSSVTPMICWSSCQGRNLHHMRGLWVKISHLLMKVSSYLPNIHLPATIINSNFVWDLKGSFIFPYHFYFTV